MTSRKKVQGQAFVLRSDARNLPLADESVDLIITSPPYFALRSYHDEGEHYEGQIGDEQTPIDFVDALIETTIEMVRVLKPTGSIWVNLGDKYSRGSRPRNQPDQFRKTSDITYDDPKYVKDTTPENSGIIGKSLMGIPWRYAIRCIDELGLILRAEVVWHKSTGLPESVKDRVARKHETWFHFTKQQKYFSDISTIKEPLAGHDTVEEGGGKLPESVWRIAAEPLKVPSHLNIKHYAAFPTEFPRRIIEAWAPPMVCGTCGVPDTMIELCKCEGQEVFSTAVVLDPFGGSGTTAAVAKALGRTGISNDLSMDYCKLAEWRTNGDGYKKVVEKITKMKKDAGKNTLF